MEIKDLDMDSFLNDPRLLVCFTLGILCARLKGRTYTMLCKKEVCDLDSASHVQKVDLAKYQGLLRVSGRKNTQ